MTDQTVEQQQTPAAPAAPAAPPGPRSLATIAREMYGDQYKAKAEAETPKQKPEEKAPSPDNTEEGDVLELDKPVEGEPEVGEPETGEEKTAPAEDTGETPIATVSELVEHLEADPDWFNTLKVPVQVDGTPTEATIGDLIKSYQVTEAAEHRLEDAKRHSQANTEAWAAKQQELDGQFQVLAELIKAEEATLEREVQAIDPSLRDSDPAEWAARIMEFGNRRAHIDQMKSNAVNKYKANAETRAKEFETWKQQTQAEQSKLLLDKLPEWREPKKAETEKMQIADYLVRAGFTPAELANLIDHRQVLLARKAMLYDQSRGQVDAAKKRVAKVPKVMKPGAPKPAEQRATERLQALKSKLDKTGSMEDAMAYRMAKRGARR